MKRMFKGLFLIIIISYILISLLANAENKFKLKPGATGKLCLGCHSDFEKKLKKQFVHTPVKTEECSECHNPHTSSHGKLLYEDQNKICLKCHEEIIPKKALSQHLIAKRGECVRCHDPHSSNFKSNLLKAGNELCFDCHKDMASKIEKVKFKHTPVERGCLNCHDPHGSINSGNLLKEELAPLCLRCHRSDSISFSRQHMNYPVEKGNCSLCHDAHGSNIGGILHDNFHKPVLNKMCSQCHDKPISPNPFKAKKTGYELCQGCHSNMINEAFNKRRIHWPIFDKEGCLNCHKPHASSEKYLLISEKGKLCGRCHIDTLKWQVRLEEQEKRENLELKGKVIKGSLTHPPVMKGECDICHSPHASDSPFMLKKTSIIELCGDCHDWSKHSNHPMGPKIVDSRNKNITMDCLSCHRSHGSGNRYLIPFPTVTDLCVQCHKEYKR